MVHIDLANSPLKTQQNHKLLIYMNIYFYSRVTL